MFRVLTKFLPSFITEFWITVLRVKLDRLMFNQDLRSVEWMNEWMNEKMNEWKRNNRRPRRANVDVENQTRRGNQILAAKTEPIRRRACLPSFFFYRVFLFFGFPFFFHERSRGISCGAMVTEFFIIIFFLPGFNQVPKKKVDRFFFLFFGIYCYFFLKINIWMRRASKWRSLENPGNKKKEKKIERSKKKNPFLLNESSPVLKVASIERLSLFFH